MKNLNDKIKKLFASVEGPLNAKVVKMELQKAEDDTEFYEAPVVVLTDGGATVVINGKAKSVALEAPAKAEFVLKKVHPQKVFYRIALAAEDAAKADSDNDFFNSIVPAALNEAIRRYNLTFGGPDVTRYGKFYCTISDVIDSGDFVEVRLMGDWASETALEQA